MLSNSKPDIVWILIDGIRPDKLRSCGNLNRPHLFIDEVLLKGTLFTTVISAGANTRTAMHAIFTSLNPSINKMNAYNPALQTRLDPKAVTLTDLLRHANYKTFRYHDPLEWLLSDMVDVFQAIPTSGFHIWESSGYKALKDTPNHSFITSRRDAFIKNFNQTKGPKFAYIHLLTSHDLNVQSMSEIKKESGRHTMSSKLYEENLFAVSDDFEDVWNKLDINDKTLIIISTDHGARLDFVDIYEEEQKHGMRLRDISMNTFCAIIGLNIPKQVINQMVRTIDIVPTILDIAKCKPLLGQGISLLPLIQDKKLPQLYGFMETGGIYEKPASPDKSNVWGVRTDKWKYWKHEWRGEWLIDLEKDPNEEINLIGKGLSIENKLRKLVKDELIENTKTAEQIYAENAKASNINEYFTKKQIIPEISLYLIVQDKDQNSKLPKVIKSILAQICVYFELIVVDTTFEGSARAIIEEYQDYRVSYQQHPYNKPLCSLFNKARGKYISCISPEIFYYPYFLYELRNILQERESINLVYANYHLINQIGFKRIVNTDKVFNKRKNVCYCFLFNKKAVKSETRYKTKFFGNMNSCLDSKDHYHISMILGEKYYQVNAIALNLHRWVIAINNIITFKRKNGWQFLLKAGMNKIKAKSK
ncbi:MAG: sulfatase-like hydrolase/transferase [Promethearchaeota archaeon]